MGKIELKNIDCLQGMKLLTDNSINVILTDPPYLYLKGQKLEREFDEQLFFLECKRLLKKDGFIVLFGRGTSFYRWNTRLADLGFEFKEEIIWNKIYNTSPVTPINRVHETITIYSKKSGSLNLSFVPYVEMKTDIFSIQQDINRIKSALNNKVEFDDLCKYLQTGLVDYKPENRTLGNNTTVQTSMPQQSRGVKTMQAMKRGLKEKSIIAVNRDHYQTIHPTKKPVRLIERLLALVSKQGDTVLDPFGGSFSTMEACYNIGLDGIAYEIDEEYFNAGQKRINEIQSQQKLF